MNYFSTIIYISFGLWAIRNILFWVGLWQDKEYRIDRIFVHFRETMQGKHIFFSWGNACKWIFFFFYVFIIFHDTYAGWYEVFLGIFFIAQGFIVLIDVFHRRIKRPTFTSKAIFLVLASLGVIALFLFFPLMNTFLWLLLVDRLLPLIVALFVFFLSFPTEIYQDIKISQAKNKMKRLSNILVIAVSGSYGKTSTKEYIAQILSNKFQVVKTPGSNNTPFGIANTILKKIHENTEIFVVEMGAYKRGEIAELTRIVQPEISITTAISDQHISLYGSLQNVIESEYELLHALPKNGLSLFNANSENTEILYERTKTDKIFYQRFTRKPKHNTIIGAYNVQATTQWTLFTVVLNGREFNCKVHLFGVHTVENILPAIFLANHLGFKEKEIMMAVEALTPPAQTMVKKILRNGVIAMDDTFNISPESVMSAMDFLSVTTKKKIFVLAPLTELGKQTKLHHYKIGKKAGEICDYLFLLNKNFSEDILDGVENTKGTCHVEISRPEVIAKSIAQITEKGDMIIFEGKESKMVMKKLL